MKYFVVILLLLFNITCFAEADDFEFDGISLKTEKSIIKKKYSTAITTESFVRLSLNDLVSGKYPRCRFIFNKIYRNYDGPNLVRKFYEESIFIHDRIWQRKDNSLSLRCFEKGDIRYAEWISLY